MPNDSLEANDEVKRMKMFKWITLNNWPIRYKLIMHFLLISILPAICLGILIALATDRIIEKQVNEHTSQLIGNVNKSLEAYAGNLQNITYFTFSVLLFPIFLWILQINIQPILGEFPFSIFQFFTGNNPVNCIY